MPRLSFVCRMPLGWFLDYLLLNYLLCLEGNTITLRMVAYYITMYKVIEGFKLNLRAQIIRHRS